MAAFVSDAGVGRKRTLRVPSGAVRCGLHNHIIRIFILSCELISGNRHHNLVQSNNVMLSKG